MKVIVYENRDLIVFDEFSSQNENDFEVMEFKFSSLFDNYNKKIVFLTPDGNISYYINNNIFSIPREITQYEQVKFYIWCTFENKDFRTKLKILSFYKNENVNIDILPLKKAQIEQIINELEKNILIVQNLEKQTTNLIDEIETKLKNGDFVGPQGETGPQGPQGETGPQGPQGEPGESYDDTEIKEEISDIKEEQTTQNARIEELEEQVSELESNQLTGTATGQSIYIEDSTNAKVRSIGLSGNSEQDGEPTPENPVEIHSTGDSGSVNEKVQNKNLFDDTIYNDIANNGVATLQDNGFYEITFSSNKALAYNFKPNTQYIISAIAYGSGSGNSGVLGFNYTDGTSSVTGINQTSAYTYEVVSTAGKTVQSIKVTYGSQAKTYIKELQLEQGSTASSYVPHAEQNISFPLAQGQKLMQGDYLADDGVHHVMGEVVLDGSIDEGWTRSGTNTSNQYRFSSSIIANTVKKPSSGSAVADVLCSCFIKESADQTYSKNNGIAIHPNGNIFIFDDSFKEYTTEEFKAVLSQNPITLQYPLAEEVIDPYTSAQQAVWDQIKALRTYKPVTHISSTDEVPATVNVTYVKDLETVINNLGGA